MLYVLFFSLSGDEDNVDIGTAEVETTQNTIEALEGLGGIPSAERHFEKFKRAERGGDCRFRDALVLGGMHAQGR